MKNITTIKHETKWDSSHDTPSPASHLPFAPAKHTTSMRDVQAYRRNTHMGQPGRTPLTLSPRKEEFAAARARPQDGLRCSPKTGQVDKV